MIASLFGNIRFLQHDSLVIESGSIGYLVHISPQLSIECVVGSEMQLFIYHHITEKSQSLFGFRSWEERGLFELLLGVSGIGPKSALLISQVPVMELTRAILQSDVDMLSQIPGIGKKTAQRLILELKSSLEKLPNSSVSQSAFSSKQQNSSVQAISDTRVTSFADHHTPINNQEAIDALMALGYTRLEVIRMLGSVPVDIRDTKEIIRLALAKTR